MSVVIPGKSSGVHLLVPLEVALEIRLENSLGVPPKNLGISFGIYT